jgi:PmbA protein
VSDALRDPARGEPAADAAALARLGAEAVGRALGAGADHAEACLESVRSFSVQVNAGAIETLKQSATRGLGLRVLVGGAQGFVSSTDLSSGALDELAAHAVTLARFSTPDEANALPTPAEAEDGSAPDLDLMDPAVLAWPPERRIEMALALERIALGCDPRIRRTDGAGVTARDGHAALVNSNGLTRASSATMVSAGVAPLADEGGGKQQTGWYGMVKTHLADLEDPDAIAREAARRALERLGARQVPTARVPVILSPDIAAAWIAEMLDAFSGESHLKQTSWLTGRLDQAVASGLVTLVDDGRRPRGTGSALFDGEGMPTRRNLLIDRGRFATILYDHYHARRTGRRSTGSAVRGYSSTPGIGAHNLYVEAGTDTPEAILARVDRGFFMNDQGAYGFNSTTGDYSYQAQGFWVEGGAKAFPVEGVTVASNSLDMLRGVVAVGNDLRFLSSTASPTLLIAEMTVSGG